MTQPGTRPRDLFLLVADEELHLLFRHSLGAHTGIPLRFFNLSSIAAPRSFPRHCVFSPLRHLLGSASPLTTDQLAMQNLFPCGVFFETVRASCFGFGSGQGAQKELYAANQTERMTVSGKKQSFDFRSQQILRRGREGGFGDLVCRGTGAEGEAGSREFYVWLRG